ncbi:MAG: biopolymer transporter ExbD [Phycisphaerae bacterium]|jgi:biopolymer transport protein ExbD|nr:biopolymer transporter ExbD [Phycisphaerae bacterium]
MAGSIGNSDPNADSGRQQPPSGRIRRKARVSVPMTAMIDVTFLLLTYFLLTTTFRQDEGQLPGSLPGPIIIEPIENVLFVPVEIRAVGDACQSVVYKVGDGSEVLLRSPQELVDALRKRRGDTKDAIAVIDAGRAVRWRYVVEACNQAAGANFQTTIKM